MPKDLSAGQTGRQRISDKHYVRLFGLMVVTIIQKEGGKYDQTVIENCFKFFIIYSINSNSNNKIYKKNDFILIFLYLKI